VGDSDDVAGPSDPRPKCETESESKWSGHRAKASRPGRLITYQRNETERNGRTLPVDPLPINIKRKFAEVACGENKAQEVFIRRLGALLPLRTTNPTL